MYLIKELQFIKNKDNYVLLNLINGAADIIDKQTYLKLSQNKLNDLSANTKKQLKQRKYLFESKKAYLTFIGKLNEKLEQLEKSCPPSFLIIPSYACNLNCTYCYEQSYDIKHSTITDRKGIIDKQFQIISNIIKDIPAQIDPGEIKITLMGGEPLLPGNLPIINYILENIATKGYRANIITNGVAISAFIPSLKSEVVEHIQITLDGPQQIHDKRRKFQNGTGSFDVIMKNVKLALSNGIRIFLRVNVDTENVASLPELADLIVREFGKHPNLYPYLYLLQDGGCSGAKNVIDESIGIEKILSMEEKHPNIGIFAKKFHPANFVNAIFSNKAFQPVLRHCGAARNQYILDYKGNIHKCWHGIGNSEFRIGTFKQKAKYNLKKELWANRSVNNLKKCSTCKYRYICGTGCPAAKHGGCTNEDIVKPNCIDYEKLINMLVLKHINQANPHGKTTTG